MPRMNLVQQDENGQRCIAAICCHSREKKTGKPSTLHAGYGCLHKTDKGAQSQKEIDDREKQRERQTEKQKFQKGKGKYH